jgi:hypothetical protein
MRRSVLATSGRHERWAIVSAHPAKAEVQSWSGATVFLALGVESAARRKMENTETLFFKL